VASALGLLSLVVMFRNPHVLPGVIPRHAARCSGVQACGAAPQGASQGSTLPAQAESHLTKSSCLCFFHGSIDAAGLKCRKRNRGGSDDHGKRLHRPPLATVAQGKSLTSTSASKAATSPSPASRRIAACYTCHSSPDDWNVGRYRPGAAASSPPTPAFTCPAT